MTANDLDFDLEIFWRTTDQYRFLFGGRWGIELREDLYRLTRTLKRLRLI